ncbi:gliding motility-associated-like protein [Filimonas zeae]|uniref:PKD domain-containing protein n=1 Tax=Filimonas zeae TaxID=1737353 RepID=A0A917J306_9BACT|nr:gliding motility-associated C-terminal domain-containing protein [Filimonas zeae]MDR6342013.1 gliding motility-associated-like protein [Filimonas zeae]GGH79456.1 hypothetical protein GCM10011379_48850 [Filimonas zeae]
MTALRKVFISAIGRNVILLFCFVCMSIVRVHAQKDIVIGTGTNSNEDWTLPCPLQDANQAGRAQYLYLASELKAAGMDSGFINALSFQIIKTVSGKDALLEQLAIKIGTTTVASLDLSSWIEGATQVYGAVDYTPVPGKNIFTFSKPFLWNGRDNIVVEICNGEPNNNSVSTRNPFVTWTTDLDFVASHSYGNSGSGNLCNTTVTDAYGNSNYRPNIVFEFTPAVLCAGTPVAGSALTSAGSVCAGGVFRLSLQGNTVASGLTYQWQSSADHVNWVNIAGAASYSVVTSQTASLSYRAVVTCTASGAVAQSVPVSVYSPAAVSGTFTINKDAPAGGGNFRSFNDAYNFIRCGIGGNVVFNVTSTSGSYNEQLILEKIPGTSATKTVTFNGNGQAIEFTSSNSDERAVVKLNGASHIRLNNLVIHATAANEWEYGYGVHLLNNADSNTISNCSITTDTLTSSDHFAGVVINGSASDLLSNNDSDCDSNTVRNNIITGGYGGIVLKGYNTATNKRNLFTDNTIREFYRMGVYVSITFSTVVEGNTFTREYRKENSWEVFGMLVEQLSTFMRINGNTFTRLNGASADVAGNIYGIYFAYVETLAGYDNIISNNLMYQLGEGTNVYGLYNSQSGNVGYYHNTISLDGSANAAMSYSVIRGAYFEGGMASVVFNNNMVTISGSGPGNKLCIDVRQQGAGVAARRNNYYYPPGTAGITNIGFYNGVYYASLLDWQSKGGVETESFFVNPFYTNLAGGNLTPLNAAIDNKGLYTSLAPADIAAVTRNISTPDIGVYESTPPLCTSPPTAGKAALSKDTACSGELVLLGLEGYSIGSSQTYQWQYASSAAGPYTNFGQAMTGPDTAIRATGNTYYRMAVTCSGLTAYSDTVHLVTRNVLPGGTYTLNQLAPVGTVDFNSFTQVQAALACGIQDDVVIMVIAGSGVYNEQLVLGPVPGASADATVTFKGNGNTIQYGSYNPDNRAVIQLNGADFIIFDSLTVQVSSNSDYGYGVQLMNDADNNIFRRCSIQVPLDKADGYCGIVVNSSTNDALAEGESLCDGNVFEHNTITGGKTGIALVGSSDHPLLNNKVSGNLVTEFFEEGIRVQHATNGVVELNEITRPTRSDLSFSTHYAIVSGGNLSKLLINGNRIHNLFGGNELNNAGAFGIQTEYARTAAGEENVISNNLLYHLNGSGSWAAISNYISNHSLYYHNTVALDNVDNQTGSNAYGFVLLGDPEEVYIKNNIVAITHGGNGQKKAIFSYGDSKAVTFDYNDYYINAPGGISGIISRSGTDYTTLEQWKTVSLQDAHSIVIDPVFTNPATGNYQPAISPLDNTGTVVPVSKDILGVDRSTASADMGAYEINIPVCTTPPAAGVAAALPSSGICMGTVVQFNLTGNSTGGTQTYVWQDSAVNAKQWTNASEVQFTPAFKKEVMRSGYWRCRVVCGKDTSYSQAAKVQFNAAFPAGVYTIDRSGAGDFKTFGEAVAAMECGIEGAVTFKVKPGVYNEQVRMHRIFGASDSSRVTFQSDNGIAASVLLTYNTTETEKNYVLQLDSASFITYRNLQIQSVNIDYGRAIDLRNTAASDSIVNCVLGAVETTASNWDMAVLYSDNLLGDNNVIKGNTINNGAIGIYLNGNYMTKVRPVVIDSNFVKGAYMSGIYASYARYPVITRNSVLVKDSKSWGGYGIQLMNCDSAYRITDNTIRIEHTMEDKYGMYLVSCASTKTHAGRIERNKVLALHNNTGNLYGIYFMASPTAYVRNNVININTTGDNSYAIYDSESGNKYFNNTVQNSSASTADNYVGYFINSRDYYDIPELFNNIFSHTGGGKVFSITEREAINSDYNMLYTTGGVLGSFDYNDFTTLDEWRKAVLQEKNSIVYKPAITGEETLLPDIADAHVWAMHGRGVQLSANADDFNRQARPVKLEEGVPDLGAYEFMPSSVPPVCDAIPAVPAPGSRQVFMLGTDTVCAITWGAGAPEQIKMRRYSGVVPGGITAGRKYMYFYTNAEVTGGGADDFEMQQFYLDPWKGLIAKEADIRLGRTDASGGWLADSAGKVQTAENIISQTKLNYLARFTGLTDTVVRSVPEVYLPADTSNMGTRFWVGYGHNSFFDTPNEHEMVLYFSARDSANVTVRINGTTWERQYHITPGSNAVSDLIPKQGMLDARLVTEGWSDRGISIESDVPVAAFAHIYGLASSGASILLPVGTYGYEYYALGAPQKYSTANCYSWFYVVADHDSTLVEITPSCTTVGGHAANVPFNVLLNKGEVYQVLGALQPGSLELGYEVTGSKIKSIAGPTGKCYPVGVFSGTGRTSLSCDGQGTSGDNMLQQNFPYQAWGYKYLTAPAPSPYDPETPTDNLYRVLVKDPATKVMKNGVLLTGMDSKGYYEYYSHEADYIEADQPVMMAQYMLSDGACGVTYDYGDPEMVYLSPVEQGIKQATFYRTRNFRVRINYLVVTIPDEGLQTLLIDGSNAFDYSYAHPGLPGYTVVIKRWSARATAATVSSDVAFAAITYGLGEQESYAYSAGTMLRNLNPVPGFVNVYDSSGRNSAYTCAGTPFRFNLLLPVKPAEIVWGFGAVPQLSPGADSVQLNPVPLDSVMIGGRKLYRYTVQQSYAVTAAGTYTVPVVYKHPDIQSCNQTAGTSLVITVLDEPVCDFSVAYSGCMNDVASFTGSTTGVNGGAIHAWQWNFDDNTGAGVKDTVKQFVEPGIYEVKMKAIGADGCVADTMKRVQALPYAALNFVRDTVRVCAGEPALLEVKNPEAGIMYNWYDAASGGSLVTTGNSYTVTNVTGVVKLYVAAVKNGCASPREQATAIVLEKLVVPVVTVDSAGVNVLRFVWGSVPGAIAYEVSVDGGVSWITPSSGSSGLVHTMSVLRPGQEVSFLVKAKGASVCQDRQSEKTTAATLPDQVFIPNSFSPNGDGVNDIIRVYGFVVKEVTFMVFNQWGQKVFETRNQTQGWDGNWKGKPQPSGVYIYVCKLVLTDGSTQTKKGSINLVR